MRKFWFELSWPAVAWLVYLAQADVEMLAIGLLGCAIFWTCYFLYDLFRGRLLAALILHVLSIAAIYLPLYASKQVGASDVELWFAWLVSSYITWRNARHTSPSGAATIGLMTACALITYAILEGHLEQLPYLLIVLAAVAAAGIAYMRSQVTISEATARYDALLSEYRKLKREARNHEEAARIEERTHIARRIHDSVGHKLTSLLMQLETFRMQADGEYKQIAEQMKRLAQDSLQETRSAVKALKEEEPGGMQALLRLIRNLEAESYMQVEFVVRHGALSVVLDNDQSAAVYRSIQEALTNAMRHGSSRKVNILLESPGGSIFRFEVTNETSEYQDAPIREGFGLTAMRERVESAGGTLEIARQRNKFVVRGTFVLSQP